MAGNLDKVLPDRFALRGIIANVDAALALRFQFNPTEVRHTKDVKYDITDVPGWDHPDILYSSGGAKKIMFDLMFDRTQGSVDSGFAAFGVPLVGTEAVKAVFESFLYPQRGPLPFTSSKKLFVSPPKALLILGTNFYEGYLEGGQEIKDVLFDKLLTPLRTAVPVSFIVLEEGKVAAINAVRRQSLALANSVLALADVVAEIF